MDFEDAIDHLSAARVEQLADLLGACLMQEGREPRTVERRAEHLEAAMQELGFTADPRFVDILSRFPTSEASEGFIAQMQYLSSDGTLLRRLSSVDISPCADSWMALGCQPLVRHLSPSLLKVLFEQSCGFDVTLCEIINAAILSNGIFLRQWTTEEDLHALVKSVFTWLESEANSYPVPKVEFSPSWRIVTNGKEALAWVKDSGEYPDLRLFWSLNQLSLFGGRCVLGWNWQNRPFCLHLHFPKGEHASTS